MDKKKKKRLCVTIDSELYDEFKSYIESNGYDTSRIIEKIIDSFIKNKIKNGEK